MNHLESTSASPLKLSSTDVLAVCVVVALLATISIPAVARVAEEDKLNVCKTKLGELGKAIAGFQSAASNAWPTVSTEPIDGPPGVTTSDAEQLTEERRRMDRRAPKYFASGYSWLVILLPYIDENDLFKHINSRSSGFSRDAFDIRLRNDVGEHLSMYPIELFQCPAFESTAKIPYTSDAPEYVNFAKLGEANAVGKNGVALTNYVAVSATHLDVAINAKREKNTQSPNGVIYYHSAMKGPTKIPDGDSNTIVISETREPNYASWFDGTTSWVVAHDPNSKAPVQTKETKDRWVCKESAGCRHALNVGPSEKDAKKADAKVVYYREKWAGKEPWQYGPSSMHEDGRVNHLFADKHVVSILGSGPKAISANVYLALVTRNGGEDDSYSE